MMSESPACLLRSNSQPAATSTTGGLHENELMRALTSSISFGRYASESFVSDKWTAFTSNRYLEEAKKSSKPGSVKEMKAYFESHYKKIAANKAAALLEPSIEDSDKNGDIPPQIAQKGDDGLDLNTEMSYEIEMEKPDSKFDENENSHVPVFEEENIVNSPVPSSKTAVAVEEEEDKENIVKSPALLKTAVVEEEEENIVNIIPVSIKKPKVVFKEDKKKKPSKSSIHGSKPFNPLPPPPPPPRPSSKPAQPKPITQNKTPLRQIKKETSIPIIKRIQQTKKDDSIPVIMKMKKKTAASNLLQPNPVNKSLAEHKKSSQSIAADNGNEKEKEKEKEKKKRMLFSPVKQHKVQEKKVEKKKSVNSKTQLPTINHHQLSEKKKKKSSEQELNQRPPWRFSFKCSPERKNGGGGAEVVYPVNSMMTPRKKRIFR